MKRLTWFGLLSLICMGLALPVASVVAQEDTDGLEEATLVPATGSSAVEGMDDPKERYLVAYARNRGFGTIRMTTDVSVTNSSRRTCSVQVDFYIGNGNLACTAPLMEIPPGHTYDFCTRKNPATPTICNSVCPGPDFSWEGHAVVISDRHCRDIAVDARVMYTNSSNSVEGVSNSNIVKKENRLGIFGR